MLQLLKHYFTKGVLSTCKLVPTKSSQLSTDELRAMDECT